MKHPTDFIWILMLEAFFQENQLILFNFSLNILIKTLDWIATYTDVPGDNEPRWRRKSFIIVHEVVNNYSLVEVLHDGLSL